MAPGTAELQRAVSHEGAACEANWQGEWSRALDCIRQVIDALRGGRAPQRYAALWNYLASCIAHRLVQQTGDHGLGAAATKFYDAARAAGRGTTWLSNLAASAEGGTASVEPGIDPLDEQAMTGVLANAARLARPSVFDIEVQ